MEPRELLDALAVADRLKDTTRHCYTVGGRHDSVAEHSWRAALMPISCGTNSRRQIWTR